MKILANYYQYAISGVVNGENVRDAISLLKESALSFSNNTFLVWMHESGNYSYLERSVLKYACRNCKIDAWIIC